MTDATPFFEVHHACGSTGTLEVTFRGERRVCCLSVSDDIWYFTEKKVNVPGGFDFVYEPMPVTPEEAQTMHEIALRFFMENFDDQGEPRRSYADLLEEENELCAEIEAWSKEQGLEWRSADEMLADLPDDADPEQVRWLSDFIDRWDDLMDRQYAAREAEETA